VDHITPHRGDLKLFWQRSNWQALCTPCHSGRKQSQEKRT
jgi:5-methylcytosine-specific restriction endonuclease McrA